MVELDFGVVAFQKELVHYRLAMKRWRRLSHGNDGDHLFSHNSQMDRLTTIEYQGGCENRRLGQAEGRATESWPSGWGAESGAMQVKEQPKVGAQRVSEREQERVKLHGKTRMGRMWHDYSRIAYLLKWRKLRFWKMLKSLSSATTRD